MYGKLQFVSKKLAHELLNSPRKDQGHDVLIEPKDV
jgi:hypothetical protein